MSIFRTVTNPIARVIPLIVQQAVIIFLALVGAAVVLEFTGYNPMSIVDGLGRSVTTDVGGTIRWATPLILMGLAASLCFRGNAWNIGLDGQLYLGAITTAVLGLVIAPWVSGPLGIAIILCGAMLAGGLYAAIPGVLRIRWGANEVVTTILLNNVALLLTNFLVLGPFKSTTGAVESYSTDLLPEGLWLPNIIPASGANAGFYIGLVLAVLIAFLFFRTTYGYELKVMGTNLWFGHFGGMNMPSLFMKAMVSSGAVAGLTGGIEVLGILHLFTAGFNNQGLGFNGIVVTLLAQNNPIGCVLAGLFFGALTNGALNMQRVTEVPRAMVQLVQALIVLAISVRAGVELWHRWRDSRANRPKGEGRAVAPVMPPLDEVTDNV